MSTNVTWHANISYDERVSLRNQKGCTVWLTGLSASGKSTIACRLEKLLLREGISAYRLDGDNIRFGLNKDLGFTEEDRNENIRRIAEVAKLFADSCTVSIAAFISPYKADREKARELHKDAGLDFIEVFIDVPIEVAEDRDPKELYKKARAGIIKDFTGISAPYEAPENPDIHLRTDKKTIEQCADHILQYLKKLEILQSSSACSSRSDSADTAV
ncbi:AaceriAAR001Wp [[Ashbya] aceris (nom. inval.)]|nr:AaceriAAR001Wp [[Ashbya] aceris (nom. inval.)]